jgi:ribosomal protein L11 methylase PrmA
LVNKQKRMKTIEASFRDPSGYVFLTDGVVRRTVNTVYKEHFDFLFTSGLYQILTENDLMVSHREVKAENDSGNEVYKVIEPEQIDFITYPSEWTFGMLKDAALLTLHIQLTALKYGMILKDASPYNVQFRNGKPVWIDTLSFEKYVDGMPWNAYRQFCEQFLAPLAVMSETDLRLSLLKMFPAGVPLDIAIKSLPWRKRFSNGLFLNLLLHSRVQRKQSAKQNSRNLKTRKIPKSSLEGHVTMLEKSVKRLGANLKPASEWNGYYKSEEMSMEYLNSKEKILRDVLKKINPSTIYDLGANTGFFSKVAGEIGSKVIALEKDPYCAEFHYKEIKEKQLKNVIPLVIDLMDPCPPAGWAGEERKPLWERKRSDVVVAFALLHHLSLIENVPFSKIAELFGSFGDQLIVEYISPDDPNAAAMLTKKPILYNRVSLESFRNAFSQVYDFNGEYMLPDGNRIIFHLVPKK